MAKGRNDDVINGPNITEKKITPQTVPSPYIKDQGAKNCKSKAFSSQKKKGHGLKSTKMSSYSINIYKQWTLRNQGFAAHRCAPGHYATFRSRESSIFYLIQYKCSTSLEAKFHGASKSAISFFHMVNQGLKVT